MIERDRTSYLRSVSIHSWRLDVSSDQTMVEPFSSQDGSEIALPLYALTVS